MATAIMALGATRQTKSHVKATLGIGNSMQCVNGVVHAVSRLVEWADRPPIDPIDVNQLADEIQAALKR